MRDAVLRQLPDSNSIQQVTGPIINVQVRTDYAGEVHSSHGIRYARPELLVPSPKHSSASISDYEQMVVVRTAKDDALAAALKSRLRPLAEAIAAAAAL